MPFQASESTDATTSLLQYVLDGAGGSHATIVPVLGCNCVSWQVAGRELLCSPPMSELAERPTRGGIPVLFPFPNRIRAGRFIWDGREYQLPCNDSTQANAIHGFTPRVPWRVLECSAESACGHFVADFVGSRDAQVDSSMWPGDPRMTLKIVLHEHSLRLEATVMNADNASLPFGLGYHPYFAAAAGDRVESPARGRWELEASLPTGAILPVEGQYDLRHARSVEELTLDDVYTDFPAVLPGQDGLVERGRLLFADGGSLTVRTSPAFRDLVVFTPPHRKAVCLEPYTCPTDAVNLTAHGLDVGWLTVKPSETWRGTVEFRFEL
jgi:aldose 1-epimerase